MSDKKQSYTFVCESDGKMILTENTTDADGVEALAGSKVVATKKAMEGVEAKAGDIFTCERLKWRAKGNFFYASENVTKTKNSNKKEKPSIYDVLSVAPKPKGFIVKDDVWTLLLRNIKRGKHTVLTGPTGSGKTELIHHAAELLEYNCIYFNIGNSSDPRSKLIGNLQLTKSKDGSFNVTDFVESRFVKAIQTEKTVILLDEINRSNPEVNNILLTLLDGSGYLELDEHEETGVVYKNPSCVIVGTANIGDEYVGTNILDRAFKDRVFTINVDYLTKDEEKSLLMGRTNIDSTNADMISEFAETCRGLWKGGDLCTPVSTRMTLEAAALIKDGFSFEQSIEASVLPFFEDDGTAGSDATKVKVAMQKKG